MFLWYFSHGTHCIQVALCLEPTPLYRGSESITGMILSTYDFTLEMKEDLHIGYTTPTSLHYRSSSENRYANHLPPRMHDRKCIHCSSTTFSIFYSRCYIIAWALTMPIFESFQTNSTPKQFLSMFNSILFHCCNSSCTHAVSFLIPSYLLYCHRCIVIYRPLLLHWQCTVDHLETIENTICITIL